MSRIPFRPRSLAWVVGSAAVALVAFAGPALAASATFSGWFDSGKYETQRFEDNTSSGGHQIDSRVTNCGLQTGYTIEHRRHRPLAPDESYGTRSATCGSLVTRRWSATALEGDTGTFYYKMTKNGGGYASGTMYW